MGTNNRVDEIDDLTKKRKELEEAEAEKNRRAAKAFVEDYNGIVRKHGMEMIGIPVPVPLANGCFGFRVDWQVAPAPNPPNKNGR